MILIASLSVPARAQFSCPAPWANAQNVYGIVMLDGSGNGSAGDFTQSVNQHAVAAGKLARFGRGSCVWQAIPQVGFGQMKSQGNVNDTVTDGSVDGKVTVKVGGPTIAEKEVHVEGGNVSHLQHTQNILSNVRKADAICEEQCH